MKTVTLDVRAPADSMADFAHAWKTTKAQKTARISFATPELLWRVLTEKRWELLKVLCGAGPVSIREAARRVERDVKAVHGDTCYGTSIASVQKAVTDGKRPVMEIDVQGALELTQAIPSLRPIFILPPSYEIWMERLGTRGSISDGEKMRRLRSASMEIQTALDHPAFLLVVNQEVNFTAQDLIRGIQPDSHSQQEARELALELMQYLR